VFQLKSVTVPPPGNGSQANGSCDPTVQFIRIYYSDHSLNFIVTFNFNKDKNNMYYMNSFSLEATTINNSLINGW